MNTKNRSTPVVEKKEETCGCGCKDCNCGPDCKCGCNSTDSRTLSLCGTILLSAVLVAGSILMKPAGLPVLPQMPRHHRPAPAIARPEPVKTDAAIREFIMKNPQVLIESVDKFYKAEEAKAAGSAKARAQKAEPREFKLENLPKADSALVQKIIDDKTNYSLGNKNGKFVIIEFFDYNCGWCKRTNQGLEEAVASAEGKNIRWIPIDTPIFGEGSETIARYVLAAGEQGKYAEMHAAVGAAKGRLDEEALLELAKGLKLDTKKLTADANGEKIKAKLASNNEYREKLNIRGVPMVIVDGRINGGALFGDNLATVVKESAKK